MPHKNNNEPSAFSKYIRELQSISLLTKPEARELIARAQQRDQLARDRVVLSNQRLVIKIAAQYKSTASDILDLVQVGNIGLIRAIEKFDLKRKIEFSTYASIWIKHAISRHLQNTDAIIRIPTHVRQKINSEIKRFGRSEWVENSPIAFTSLDNDTEYGSIIDQIQSGGENSDDRASRYCIRRIIDGAIENLTETEKIVIKMRFGYDDGENTSLSEIGRRLGRSKERIRQIEAKALKKLKSLLIEQKHSLV